MKETVYSMRVKFEFKEVTLSEAAALEAYIREGLTTHGAPPVIVELTQTGEREQVKKRGAVKKEELLK